MDAKQTLQKLIDDIKTKQFREGEAKGLVGTIGDEIKQQLSPLFESHSKEMTSKIADAVSAAVKDLKVEVPKMDTPQVSVNVPDIHVPEFNIPTPKVTVNIPKAERPLVNVPAPVVNFPSQMSLKPGEKPFPVVMMDLAGKPMQFPISMGASGGKADFFTIKDIQTSSGASIIDQVEGAVKVTGSFSVAAANNSTQAIDSSGNAYSQANPFPVTMVSGGSATTGSALVDSSGVQYSGSNPLPVTFTGSSSTSVSIVNSDGTYYNSDNPLPIATAATGLNENTAGVLKVFQITSAINSINNVQWNGTTVDTNTGASSAGTLRTVLASNSTLSTQTVTDAVANADQAFGAEFQYGYNGSTWDRIHTNTGDSVGAVRVTFATDAGATVATGLTGLNETNANVLRVVQMTDSVSSVVVNSGTITGVTNTVIQQQLSGAADSVNVLSFNGNTPATGLNETNAGVLRTVTMTDSVTSVNLVSSTALTVTSITNSTAASIVDSSGVQYSGSNPVPITVVSGAPATTNAVYTRQTNPTAIAADYVPMAADDLGRPVFRSTQVRDLIKTAYVSVTTGTETTLLAGVASAFLDCIMLTGSNNSDAAVSVDIRAVTAGNIVHTLRIPANATAGWAPAVPWPQDATGNNWTVDGPDETGRTLTFSALFSQEV